MDPEVDSSWERCRPQNLETAVALQQLWRRSFKTLPSERFWCQLVKFPRGFISMSFHLFAKGSQDSFDPGFVHTVIAFGGRYHSESQKWLLKVRPPQMSSQQSTSTDSYFRSHCVAVSAQLVTGGHGTSTRFPRRFVRRRARAAGAYHGQFTMAEQLARIFGALKGVIMGDSGGDGYSTPKYP